MWEREDDTEREREGERKRKQTNTIRFHAVYFSNISIFSSWLLSGCLKHLILVSGPFCSVTSGRFCQIIHLSIISSK